MQIPEISPADHDRAIETILDASPDYLNDEIRPEAAVLASHLIERLSPAHQVAAAYVVAGDLPAPDLGEIITAAASATTEAEAIHLLALTIRHARTFIRSS